MQKCEKRGTVLVFIGVALFVSAFLCGVSAAGIILMAAAIATVGYGAGSVMDSPCGMVKK